MQPSQLSARFNQFPEPLQLRKSWLKEASAVHIMGLGGHRRIACYLHPPLICSFPCRLPGILPKSSLTARLESQERIAKEGGFCLKRR